MNSEDAVKPVKSTTYAFGEFHLEAKYLLLTRNAEIVPLAPKTCEVLLTLIESNGKLVTKQEILDKVWANTFVEEANLTHHISALRKILGEDKNGGKFIETIPRRGYRFAATVCENKSDATEIVISERLITRLSEEIEIDTEDGKRLSPVSLPSAVKISAGSWLKLFLWAGCAVVLMSIAAAFYFNQNGKSKKFDSEMLQLVPVTSDEGQELESAVSFDGNFVAYAGAEFVSDKRFPNVPQILSPFNLYVKQVNGEKSLKLTDKPGRVITPAWSPDGRFIAYAYKPRLDRPENSILYIIPALGGTERKIYEAENLAYLAWSPDGKSLAFAVYPNGTAGALYVLDLETRTPRQITFPGSGEDIYPTFSPDGNFISYAHRTNKTLNVFVVPTAGGEPAQITDDNRATLGRVAWMPDGLTLIFGSNRTGSSRLWTISADGKSEPQLLDGAGEPAHNPSISADGRRLTFTRQDIDWNIWRVPLVQQKGLGERRERIIASTRMEKCAAVSPDGGQIAFSSNQSGAAREIWLAAADGSQQRQFTMFEKGAVAQHPVWSPDGKRVAFDASTTGVSAIYTLDADGGLPQKLTEEKTDALAPNWSRDGKFIYFAAQHDNQMWQVWRVAAAGDTPPEQMTLNGGYEAHESPDGKYLYFNKAGYGTVGIFRQSLDIQAKDIIREEKVLDLAQVDSIGEWIVTETGIFYLHRLEPDNRLSNDPRIRFYDFATQQISDVLSLPLAPLSDPCLSLSPTKDWLYYSLNDKTQVDIILLERFN